VSDQDLDFITLDARLASLEARVAALEKPKVGPVLVSEEGICGVEPAIDSATCPYGSLYRRRKGCLGTRCVQASAEYYTQYRAERAVAPPQ